MNKIYKNQVKKYQSAYFEATNVAAQGRQTMRSNEPGNAARLYAGQGFRKTAALFAVPCSRWFGEAVSCK